MSSLSIKRSAANSPDGKQRWGLVEWFMLAQWLTSIALMLPGSQAARFAIRALPYAGNAAFLLVYCQKPPSWKRFPGTHYLIIVSTLLAAEMFHPQTSLIPGLAQLVFCSSIAASAFWGGKAIRDKQRLDRLLYMTFFFSATGAVVGFFQAKYGILMPAQFSSVALAMDAQKVQELTYAGANGQAIIRPPGLSDMPAGACGSAMYAIVLGIALALGSGSFRLKSAAYLAIVLVATVTLYLTQVRVMFVGAVAGVVLIAWAAARQKRVYGMIIIGAGAAVLTAAFLYAVAIGGAPVFDRFATLVAGNPADTYQSNRGHFVTHTIDDLLPVYPLGAGLGRWGMMRTYTEPYADDADPPAIWAEIQMTGWLLDGGFPMWILYGAAILSSLAYAYQTAKTHRDPDIRYLAGIVLALNAVTVLMAWDAPVFNSGLGAEFWKWSSALAGVRESAGAARTSGEEAPGWNASASA
jgi:hypothetical protein